MQFRLTVIKRIFIVSIANNHNCHELVALYQQKQVTVMGARDLSLTQKRGGSLW